MTTTLKLLSLLGLLGLPLLLLAACGNSGGAKAGESTLDKIKRTGVIKVGYADEAPYAYYDRQHDRPTGESPEILRKIIPQLGAKKIEGQLVDFGSLIPGLKAGRFDIIAAGMYITPKRAKEINFTNPTYGIGEAFIVKKSNPRNLHSYSDIKNNPNTRLGVVTGAIEASYAHNVGIPDGQVSLFPDAATAVAAVQSGRVDAYGGTSLTVLDLLAKAGPDAGIERAEPFKDPIIDGRPARGYGAYGIRKGDTQLLQAMNQALATFIGTPEHLATVKPFGFTSHDLPGDVTAAELEKPAPADTAAADHNRE